MRLCTVATCSLNQWAMDFSGNLERILRSVDESVARGARFRLGPELEVSGYGCEDHFYEPDTFRHSWEVLVAVAERTRAADILLDIGVPVVHRHVRYNCRAFVLHGKLLLLRPKLCLCDDGNYRESRWFTAWTQRRTVEPHPLPDFVQAALGQSTVPIGDAILELGDCRIASESCEELFTPAAPHIDLGLSGVDLFANGSGSHHTLRKLQVRTNLIQEAVTKVGGVYLYANQQGCDGGRLYYDGCCSIAHNDQFLAQGSQFSLVDVEVLTATVDLDETVAYRLACNSRAIQADAIRPQFPLIPVPFTICNDGDRPHAAKSSSGPLRLVGPTPPITMRIHTAAEEIALGPACWLWDYLRRSGLRGYLVPLSGGADSGAVVAIVGSMCQLVVREAARGNTDVIQDVHRIAGWAGPYRDGFVAPGGEYVPRSAKELAHRILYTCFLGTEHNGAASHGRAATLAAEVGAYHMDFRIDEIISVIVRLLGTARCLNPFAWGSSSKPDDSAKPESGSSSSSSSSSEAASSGSTSSSPTPPLVFPTVPRFRAHGGTPGENIALQNLQARIRMVVSFMFAQLLPWARGSVGCLLVLGTGNVDECLRGYFTKYDCSSADVNPIGGISKVDLRAFLRWGAEHLGYPSLQAIADATPTAELEPITETYVQQDEVDMGMTYEELSVFGRLRKLAKCGPRAMFLKLASDWGERLRPTEVARKVKNFFFYYAINRHKTVILTPSYHAENYSPDDNRFDLRQFLYNAKWTWQFNAVDSLANEMEKELKDDDSAPSS